MTKLAMVVKNLSANGTMSSTQMMISAMTLTLGVEHLRSHWTITNSCLLSERKRRRRRRSRT